MNEENKDLGEIRISREPGFIIPGNLEGSDTEAADLAILEEQEQKESKIGVLFDKIVKIGLWALAFLLPLFFLPYTANVLELNKQLLIFVFSFLLFVFWLAKVLVARKLEIKMSLLNIFVILFVLSVLVSSLLSGMVYQGLAGFGGVIAESFATVFCLALTYFLISNSFKDKKDANTLVFVLLASAFLAGLYGILQLSGHFLFGWDFAKNVSFNTVGSANALGIFLASMLVMACALFTESDRPLWQLVLIGVASVFLLFVVISLNFANIWWALVGVMAFVVGIGIIKQGRASQTRLILAMIVLAMALLINLTKINISSNWLNTPTEVSPSNSATLQIDKGVLGQHLFFGSGPASFAYDWQLYRPEAVNQTIFWNLNFNQGSSKIFSMPASLGILGIGFWLILIAFFAIWGAIRLIFKKGKNWHLAFGFFSAWLFLAAMQFIYQSNLTLEFLFWLMLGSSLFLLKGLNESPEREANQESLVLSFRRESPLASVFSFLLVIFVVLAISFFYLGFNYWRADAIFQEGVNYSVNVGNQDKAYNSMLKAASLNTFRDSYLTALSQVALLRVNEELVKPQSADRDVLIQQYIADAVNLGKAATDLNPKNPDNWIQRGTVYRAVVGYLSGAEDWMLSSFTEAAKLEPTNPYAVFEVGRSYMLLSDYNLALAGQDQTKQAKALDYLNQAEDQFNKSIALKSDYAPSIYQLALIYDRKGETDSAIQKMEITKASYPNDTGIAFQLGLLYYKKQDLTRARAEFERAVSLDGNYSNARYFLGLIYDKQGDKEAAKAQFQKIAGLNPDNAEVKKILSNLDLGLDALAGIAPPPPEARAEAPIQDNTQK